MKRLLFFIGFFLMGLPLELHSMELEKGKKAEEARKEEPRGIERPGRLFIRNNRTDATLITYQYDIPEYQNFTLQRVVYPQEVIWIDGPEIITSLKLSPHGAVMGYISAEVLTLGKITGTDYAEQMKSKISLQRGVEMTLSGPAALPYTVDIKERDTIDIVAVIPLKICKWLGDIFRRAGMAFSNRPQEIKPEYILGVPAKPSSASRDYQISLDMAVEDLISGWRLARYSEGAGLINKNKLIDLFRSAYVALRFEGKAGQEELAKFLAVARALFTQSKEELGKSCRI